MHSHVHQSRRDPGFVWRSYQIVKRMARLFWTREEQLRTGQKHMLPLSLNRDLGVGIAVRNRALRNALRPLMLALSGYSPVAS
jgi:hypothetical protein